MYVYAYVLRMKPGTARKNRTWKGKKSKAKEKDKKTGQKGKVRMCPY